MPHGAAVAAINTSAKSKARGEGFEKELPAVEKGRSSILKSIVASLLITQQAWRSLSLPGGRKNHPPRARLHIGCYCCCCCCCCGGGGQSRSRGRGSAPARRRAGSRDAGMRIGREGDTLQSDAGSLAARLLSSCDGCTWPQLHPYTLTQRGGCAPTSRGRPGGGEEEPRGQCSRRERLSRSDALGRAAAIVPSCGLASSQDMRARAESFSLDSGVYTCPRTTRQLLSRVGAERRGSKDARRRAG